jgi:hypothetical protein
MNNLVTYEIKLRLHEPKRHALDLVPVHLVHKLKIKLEEMLAVEE